MTLLITEVHALDGLRRTRVIVAADRRLSLPGGRYGATRRKVFAIDRLRGAIGYFGLATFTVGARSVCFSDWLPAFIRRSHAVQSLRAFSQQLAVELDREVPQVLRRTMISGFHVSGHNQEGLPEVWYVRNVLDDGVTVTGAYDPREEFLRTGAAAIGYDGVDPMSVRTGQGVFYRSGDIRAHVAAWELLDSGFGQLRADPAFSAPRTAAEYREWTKFKMEVIAYFYKRFARQPIVARPIDVIQLEGRLVARRAG